MTTAKTDPVRIAQDAAEAAAAAAQVAQDASEVQFLDSVVHVKQINERRDAVRMKVRYISIFGFAKWQTLCANSR